jgi:hypothetical protein
MFLSIKSWLTAAGALFVRDCGVRVSDAVSAARSLARSLDRRRAAMTDGEITRLRSRSSKRTGSIHRVMPWDGMEMWFHQSRCCADFIDRAHAIHADALIFA